MYGFKECSSCGALYNKDHCCSVDTFVCDPNETPDSSKQSLPNCPKCGDPVDGLVCRPCAFVRKCLNEVCFTSYDENESFKNLLNPPQQTQTHSFESSNDNTNFVDTPQEPIVENQDPGENFTQNSSQSPPQITQNCCYRITLLLGPPSSEKSTLLLALTRKLDTSLELSTAVKDVLSELAEVGPSIMSASLSEVLAFVVGRFIPMPACRVLSMFAGEVRIYDTGRYEDYVDAQDDFY
ncbi:reverse transcriptase domain-containing protein [Tanacetum coccineum]